MSSVSSQSQLIIGLPETGKTTFLAALWHVVTSEEVPESLRLAQLYGDVEYLNEISAKWASSEALGRTIQGAEELGIAMRLKTADGADATELVFPDMSGEAFRHLWENRQWERRYDEIAREAMGALLFIHPDKVEQPERIAEVVVPKDEQGGNGNGAPQTTVEWHPSQAGTAVKLVELVQIFTQGDSSYGVNRLAVVISAWDCVREDVTPEVWLTKRLPLLDQYLKANKGKPDYRVYGLSAQGGDIEQQAEQLRRRLRQSERIRIIGEGCSEHDITCPVKWVAGL